MKEKEAEECSTLFINTPPLNAPQVDLQNLFGFSEDYLRELEQDEANLREIRENEAHEEAARLEQETRDADYLRQNWFDIMEGKYYDSEFRSSSSDEGYNSDDSYS